MVQILSKQNAACKYSVIALTVIYYGFYLSNLYQDEQQAQSLQMFQEQIQTSRIPFPSYNNTQNIQRLKTNCTQICINFIHFDDSLLPTSKYAIKTNIELTNVPPAIVIASEYIITFVIKLRGAGSQFKSLRNYLCRPPSFIVIITVNPYKRSRGS